MKIENKTALIIENEKIIALDLKKILESIGYKVIATFTSGEEAILSFAKDKPELVIMNLKLNGLIDGVETAEIISNNHKLPIIFVTGSMNKEPVVKSKVKGPVEYIKKPFKKNELVGAVEKIFSFKT